MQASSWLEIVIFMKRQANQAPTRKPLCDSCNSLEEPDEKSESEIYSLIMETNENIRKGFIPIEPDIYAKLNWDYDLIFLCLEYIRNEIPNILKIEQDKVEVFLASFSNFLGKNYPVIGIRNKSDLAESINLDFFEIDEKVENWLNNLCGIENLKQKAKNIKCVDWKTLESSKQYP